MLTCEKEQHVHKPRDGKSEGWLKSRVCFCMYECVGKVSKQKQKVRRRWIMKGSELLPEGTGKALKKVKQGDNKI